MRLKKRLESRLPLKYRMQRASISVALTILSIAILITMPVTDAQTLTWETVTSPTTVDLRSVFCVSSSNCWAIGGSGYGTIIHWSGSSWALSPQSGLVRADFDSVVCVNANDCWAVGNYGTIIRWNGASWDTVTSPTSRDLYSAFCVNANDCWAVGNYGTIIHSRSSSAPGAATIPSSPSPAITTRGGSSGTHYTLAGVVAAIVLAAVAFLIVRKRMIRPDLRSEPSHAAAHPVRFCMNCGKKISEGGRFCTNCGTKQQ